MAFIKKVLVLRRINSEFADQYKNISGIARIESDSGITELYLTLINFPFSGKGDYFALVCDGKKNIFNFPLGKRPQSLSKTIDNFFNPESGIMAGIYYVKDNIPMTLLFAKTENFPLSLTDFKKTVAEKCLETQKNSITDEISDSGYSDSEVFKEKQNFCPTYNNLSNKDYKQNTYDDEAVATENYFELDREINIKLNKLKENEYGNLQYENGYSDKQNQGKERESKESFMRSENETDDDFSKDLSESNKKQPYFESVRTELDNIFSKFECESALERAIPNSRFSKVNYDSNNFYVVGVIRENNREKYICYGVPSVYSTEPPKELKGFCSFIPLSIFNLSGDGYWMMFQDAITGKCVHFNKNNL